MTTETDVAVGAARKAVLDAVEARIHSFEAQLLALKASAESAKAIAELTAIANLATAKRALDQKVAELRPAGEAMFRQLKGDVDARLAEFDNAIKAIASKIKAA